MPKDDGSRVRGFIVRALFVAASRRARRDSFEQAARKTKTPLVNAVGDIETGVNAETICKMVPWRLTDIRIPKVESKADRFKVSRFGAFSCDKPLVRLPF